jgi:hypothetical protein
MGIAISHTGDENPGGDYKEEKAVPHDLALRHGTHEREMERPCFIEVS